MQCKNHPSRVAEQFCASCGIPLCSDCAEEATPGAYYCFQCAMLTSVSAVGTKIKDRREKVVEEKLKEKKKWGPFRYFIVLSSVLIVVMWGVIIFGGERAPAGGTDYADNPRAFLFMVDSSLKRYNHYEKKGYPEKLADLVPKYIPLRNERLAQLSLLSYQRDASAGYRLSLARWKPGDMVIILTSKGVEYKSPAAGGV
ncbi:MAG: B-box zinc finger protein [Thermodesulfobacteriota bacterium]